LRYLAHGWINLSAGQLTSRRLAVCEIACEEPGTPAGKAAGGAGTETDPCHGYPWYLRWTDRRLAQVMCETSDNGAFDCLRRRLATERGWREAELRARVDPLRGRECT
jgi:hypothetical protein